ncbi:molybdenum cofactor cytidylyltransferase [Lachnospiraceae bacterium PF1-21]|uniref:Nucleotidyltransferase family protein n=1 Tax=Ohessyouella blattaphilus TaxID=2949333 RepID=A0ABT1EN50_9FIRM|nr:nucleotidyltransferase family protein [Ohessyouella blattaphilus]MCP1111136.1 nucleotidyltransferase family protein [Ohessyouella blattaphilus]MCR8564530.1 nucleotidyltransferase family protein [Ohessyouella blattaphilus]MDL2250219.1 nucleotidyltransferase family protein [Lachnospiraceae bacterium OttesenSCG-928-J05]
MVTAILLASGFSKRFADDKLLMDFSGKPVIEYTMEAISHADVSEKLLIQRDHTYTDLGNKYGFQSIKNTKAKLGQSQSLLLGVKHCPENQAMMFFVADQPLLTTGIINKLITTHRENPEQIILPVINGQDKNPVIFPAAFRPALLEVTGDQGGRSIIKAFPDKIKRVAFDDPLCFTDIDTYSDYQRLLSEKTYLD